MAAINIPQQANADRLLLSEIISALSYALDLTEGQPPGHCIRSCWIGFHIGRAYGLDQAQLWNLYYTILLKDAGCSSNAARLCQLYGDDDRKTKHDIKQINTDSHSELLQFVISHAGVNGGLADKLKRILNIATHGKALSTELIKIRCERGADIARRLGFDESVAMGIHALDEHWNGNGKPDGLAEEAIPINARIALLAQVIDVFHHMGGKAAAMLEIKRRQGTWFDPRLVEIALGLSSVKAFWQALRSEEIEQHVLDLEPTSRDLVVNDVLLDEIASAFGQVVDAKSPFTAGHSGRVATYTEIIANKMGIQESRIKWLRRGALLHDLGKLGVSNSILDKPDKLTNEEWHQVRLHPVYTRDILSRIAPFKELAIVSAAHHERLDGKGYPNAILAEDISLETRIITISDIFDAITAERPYRGPIPIDQAMEIMGRMVGSALDEDCYQALQSCLDEFPPLN